VSEDLSEEIARLLRRIEREVEHLAGVRDRLLEGSTTASPVWVAAQAQNTLFIDQLHSFGSQLSRTSESVASKLLPKLLDFAGETTGSVIDNLNIAHKIGWIEDPTAWTDLRRIRNRLMHEYLEDSAFMAEQISTAAPLVDMVAADFETLRRWARNHMEIETGDSPRPGTG